MRGFRYALEIDSTGPLAFWAMLLAGYIAVLLAGNVPLEIAHHQAMIGARWFAAMAFPVGGLTVWATRVFFDFRKEREPEILDEFHAEKIAHYREYRDVHLVPVLLGAAAIVSLGSLGWVTTLSASFATIVGVAFFSGWISSWFVLSFLFSISQREDGFGTDHRYRRELEKLGARK